MKYIIRFALLLVVVVMSSFNQQQEQLLLVGEWTQTNAPYKIKITKVFDNRKVEIAYFNPKSITLRESFWTKKTGTILSIYIELQDDNNTVFSYKLNYITERDVLVGEYFQEVDKNSYPVEFMRTKQIIIIIITLLV